MYGPTYDPSRRDRRYGLKPKVYAAPERRREGLLAPDALPGKALVSTVRGMLVSPGAFLPTFEQDATGCLPCPAGGREQWALYLARCGYTREDVEVFLPVVAAECAANVVRMAGGQVWNANTGTVGAIQRVLLTAPQGLTRHELAHRTGQTPDAIKGALWKLLARDLVKNVSPGHYGGATYVLTAKGRAA